MLTIEIQVTERAGEAGQVRAVDVKIHAHGHATEAEIQYGGKFKPLLQQMLNTRFLDGRPDSPPIIDVPPSN